MPDSTKINLDLTGVFTELDKFDKRLAGIEQGFRSVEKAGDTTYTNLASDIEEATAAMKDMRAAQQEVNADLKKSETGVAGVGAKIKGYIRDTQIAGKSVGEWGEQLSSAFTGLVKTAQGSGALSGAFRIMGTAIKATGIGLLITAVGGAIAYFTRFQSGIDTVSRVLESASAVVNVMVDRVVKLASAIGSFFSGDFSGAAASLEASFSGIATELVNAATAAYDLEKRVQALRDATRTANVENARLAAQLEGLRRIADDDTQSIQKRNAARRSAAKIEQQLANDAIDKALEAQQIAAGKFALDRENSTKRDALAQAEIDLQSAISEKNRAIFENEKQAREFQIKQREKSAKALKEEADALEKLRKDLEKLRVETQPEGIDQELAAVEKRFNDLQKLTADGIAKLNEIEKRRGLTSKELAERQEFADLSVKLEERRLEALSDVLVKFADKDIEIEAAQAKAKEDIRKKDYDAAKKSLDQVKKLQDSETDITEENFKNYISILEANGIDKKDIAQAQFDFDNIIKEKRLKSEIEFQQGLLALIGDGDANQSELIKNQIAKLQAQLDGLTIGQPKGDKKEKPKTILELLGVKSGSDEERAIQEAVGAVKDALEEITQARIDAAEEQRRIADDGVSKAQDALDKELELQKNGFASNVSLRQQDLENAKKFQRESIEEQKKAARQKAIIDAVQQASSIATAAAQYFSSTAAFFPVGLALAVSAIATMIATIAKIRSSARSVQAPEFGEGGGGFIQDNGFVTGRSHSDGGNLINIEKGEIFQVGESGGKKKFSVVRKERVKEYFDLLDAANRGDNEALARHAMELSGVEVDRKAVSRRVFETSKPVKVDTRNTELLEKIYKEMTKKKETYSPDGKIRKRGNVTSYMK